MNQPVKLPVATRITSHGLSIATVLIGLSILLVLGLTGHAGSHSGRTGVRSVPATTGGLGVGLLVWIAVGVLVLVFASLAATRGRLARKADGRTATVVDLDVTARSGTVVPPVRAA